MAPEITVIVLSYNSLTTIDDTLRSLRDQTVSSQRWTVLFVDHDSTDGTREQLEMFVRDVKTQAASGGPSDAKLIHRNAGNVSMSRRFAAEVSQTPWIAFVDSDVVLPSGWIESALGQVNGKLSEPDFAGVAGPIRIVPKSRHLAELTTLQQCFSANFFDELVLPLGKGRELASHLPTDAAVFRRETLLRVGGFSPVMGSCGEDLELGERLRENGLHVYIAPELVAFHLLSCETKREWIARAFRFGRAKTRVARFHPRLLREKKFWISLSSAPLQLLLLLAVLVTREPEVLLAAGFCALVGFGVLFSRFLPFSRPLQCAKVACLAWLTQAAYSLGETYEFTFSAVRLGSTPGSGAEVFPCE